MPDLVKNYKAAIERQPDLLLAYYRLGLIYKQLGEYPIAIGQFKELIKIDNKLGSAHFGLAECYQKVGNFNSAVSEQKLREKYTKEERWWKGRR